MGGPVPNPLKVAKKVVTKTVDIAKDTVKGTVSAAKDLATGTVDTIKDVAQVPIDLAKGAVKVTKGAVGDVMEAIIPMPQIPEMPTAADAGASAAETRSNAALVERDRADRLRRRRGRAATMLVQPSISAVPTGSVATKSLLGQ